MAAKMGLSRFGIVPTEELFVPGRILEIKPFHVEPENVMEVGLNEKRDMGWLVR